MTTDSNEEGIALDDDDDEDDEEEEPNSINSALRRISWLPSVLLGKQPYRPPLVTSSRREGINGEKYEAVARGGGNEDTPPQGFRSIEILPVLPMPMVRGLEGMMSMDGADEDGDDDVAGDDNDDENLSHYGVGVWEDGGDDGSLTVGPLRHAGLFTGTSNYLPHTRGHVLTVAEPRYKKLYEDLLRLGKYHAMKRDGAIRRSGGDQLLSTALSFTNTGAGKPTPSPSLSDHNNKQRFIVTAANPAEEGVFAEYGLLFQLRDFNEVAAVVEVMSMEELEEMVGIVDGESYDEDDSDDDDDDDGDDGVIEMLLRTHYEATHDVVGRVRIHRFVNPECYSDGPEGEEYLMAEVTVLDGMENDLASTKKNMLEDRKGRSRKATTLSELGDVAKAVARIKEELHSSAGEALEQKMEVLGSALDEARSVAATASSSTKGQIPLGGKGVYVERRSDDSLTKEERSLRVAFARLVALQHELKEECRFTRVSVRTFGIGPVGVWLSAAAWSQFVERRLEATYDGMQSSLQAKLVEYLADGESGRGVSSYSNTKQEMDEVIDFDDLSPNLQQEFQIVQARATEDLGPLALERAIQMQCIVQADSYPERLNLLQECIDNERRRLEAKKILKSLKGSADRKRGATFNSDSRSAREMARSVFERLATDMAIEEKQNDQDNEAFQ